ncbi:MAG: hypothetical protein ACLQFM_10035, partial [Terriglobales bacterium]
MGFRPLVCFDNPDTTTQQYSSATIRRPYGKHKPATGLRGRGLIHPLRRSKLLAASTVQVVLAGV